MVLNSGAHYNGQFWVMIKEKQLVQILMDIFCVFFSDRPCRGYLAEQEERQRRFTTVGQKKCYAKDYTVSSGFNFIFFLFLL